MLMAADSLPSLRDLDLHVRELEYVERETLLRGYQPVLVAILIQQVDGTDTMRLSQWHQHTVHIE